MRIFVPGRICLFGEHSDWAGGYRRVNAEVEKGYTLICGTNQGIHAEVEPHPTALVLTSTTPDGETRGPCEIPLEPKALLEEAQLGSFFSYAAASLPGADELPSPRSRDTQLQDRPADQEGSLLERRDQRPDRAGLQPSLRPPPDHPRRDGARLPGRDHDALSLREDGPGLRVRRPGGPDGVRRRPTPHGGDPAGEGAALRDRRPQGEKGHGGDPEAAQPLLPFRGGAGRKRRPGASRPRERPDRAPGGSRSGGGRRRAARRADGRGAGLLRSLRRARLP